MQMKPSLDEHILRQYQAAEVIAQVLEYKPGENETPLETIELAIESVEAMTKEQADVVQEMLKLSEDFGLQHNLELILESEEEDFSEEELNAMANSITDIEHVLDAYEPGEINLVDDESGEVVDSLKDELKEEVLNEVLSRIERIRAKIRFHRTEGKRERKLKVALKRHSSSSQINRRARVLAIKTLKTKLAKKPLDQLTVSEKERIERIVQQRKKVVDRLALKMTQRVRQIEKTRLAHHSTKAA
jgi:hypothetical protein